MRNGSSDPNDAPCLPTAADLRPDAAGLRRRAEEKAKSLEPRDGEALLPEETRQTLHELRVHQIELEMQNEELRRAHEELDGARERYFDLYDLAPVGYCTLNEESLILEANLTAAGLLGVARGTLVKQAITRFILPEDQDIFYRHRRQLFGTGTPQQCELRMLRLDGTQFWARLAASAAQDADGAPVCRTVLNDITEHKRAEVALRVSDERHSTILRTAMDGFWLADPQGRLLEVNETYCRMSGYSRRELLSMHISDLDLVETAADTAARIQQIMALGEGRFESRHRRKDGGFFDVEVSFQYQPTEGGRLVVFLRDITERKQAEAEREKAFARQEGITLLQRSLLAPAALADKLKRIADAIVRLFEADFCRVWLVRPADLCEHGCFHGRVAEGPRVCLGRDRCLHLVASSGRYTHTDGEVHRRVPLGAYKIGRLASGERHNFLSNDVGSDPRIHNRAWARQLGLVSSAGYQLRVPGGDALGVLALFAKHPISPSDESLLDGLSSTIALVIQQATAQDAKDRAEAQMLQAQKMEAVGRLAGGVAHDFNNLLTVINGLAELAASELSPNDPLLPRLQGILDAGGRAANLTRQLLTFSRQQVVCPRALDLNEAVGGMERMLRRLIGEDIELVWKPGAGVWRVHLDPSQVDQLLANLVVNARDAIPGTGTVIVGTSTAVLDEAYCTAHAGSTPGEYAVLTVSDTGVGIDRGILAHIFEPFFTTKEHGAGTGLGLSTVYGIVKQAGGSIYAYSEPGQGTTFRINLPRWKGGETAALVRDGKAKPVRGTETVLLVEDEEQILELGRTILERQGYRVLTAGTPDEALLAAEKESGEIHLLATDVVMPGMNGRELAERLRILRPNLKCLYLSGYTADMITQRGVLPEGVNFLQKPYSLKTLVEKVRAVLEDSAG